jgi:hypothetical protein
MGLDDRTKPLAATLAAAGALAMMSAPAAFARPATTTPGVVYTIKVVLTDTSISIGHDRFSLNGMPRYPRAAVIHYAIVNKGTRPYVFQIWDVHTSVIRPGKHTSILVNWNYRGLFKYATLYHDKPAGPKGQVIIF